MDIKNKSILIESQAKNSLKNIGTTPKNNELKLDPIKLTSGSSKEASRCPID
jgi:hypothetical protein